MEAIGIAFGMIAGLDPRLTEIVGLSLSVSLGAVAAAAVIGLPLGAMLAVTRFPGRRALVVVLDAFMGLPPVVVGLLVYLSLSRSGPLGELGLLFTPAAMVVAQAVLVFPILAALTRQSVAAVWEEIGEQLRSFGVSGLRAVPTLLFESRGRLATVLLAGFGRAIAEVGAVMIVGGNIAGHTRTMTTAIALETSRGDLALAVGLGIVLITTTVAVNALVHLLTVPASASGARLRR